MAPGIFRLRTACCTLVVPVRLAICLPLLICTLDAYSPHATLFPQAMRPLIVNITRPEPTGSSASTIPEDEHGVHGVYEYIALPSRAGAAGGHHPHPLGRALTLSFVIAAAVLSVLSMAALRWLGEPPGGDCDSEDDDATLVEGERARRLHIGGLLLGTATRLLLGGLGTTAMVRVISERSTIKRGSFIAVEVLGWLLVAVLYCGAFHRIHCLLSGSGALWGGGGREVLPGSLASGKRDGTLEPVSRKI
ncbi:hypothetical protein BC827DRAFT_1154258 [Russula dissimulans]|nr:hypothetical protein BC827DRAFT_1154258 [Russula dissimulans]